MTDGLGTDPPHAVLSRRRLFAILAAAAAVPCVTCVPVRTKPKTFGLAIVGAHTDAVAAAQSTAKMLGKPLHVVSFYEAFSWQRSLPTQLLQTIASIGSTPEITWEPWNPLVDAAQSEYALGEIAGGRYDAYIARWAKDAAAYEGRILLRFAHEMNGKWYPWSVRTETGTPADYVAAFRRVHQIFVDAGASNVEWVWCPNVIINGDTDSIAKSYPGDDLVSIVAVDGYNFGAVDGHNWTQPEDLFGPTLDLLTSIAPAKPLWINEVGCGEHGGDKMAWFRRFVDFLNSTKVAGLVLFEVDKPGYRDWRITRTPEMAADAKSALLSW